MPSDCYMRQVIQSWLGFQIFEVDFNSSCHKCHFRAIFWLLLNRLRKTYLALQWIRVVVYRTAFFIKECLFSKTVN